MVDIAPLCLIISCIPLLFWRVKLRDRGLPTRLAFLVLKSIYTYPFFLFLLLTVTVRVRAVAIFFETCERYFRPFTYGSDAAIAFIPVVLIFIVELRTELRIESTPHPKG
jgi:hypothetical protein